MAKGKVLSMLGKKGRVEFPPVTLDEVKRDNEFNDDRAHQIEAVGELLSYVEVDLLSAGTVHAIGWLLQDLSRAIYDNLTLPASDESELEEEAAQ